MSFLRKLFFKNNRKQNVSDLELLLGGGMEERLEHAPGPWVLTVVAVWIVSAVLLSLTSTFSYSSLSLTPGSIALQDYRSPTDFSYIDKVENAKVRARILENVPVYCRILPQRTNAIQRELSDLFTCVETRAAAIRQRRPYETLKDSLASVLAAGMSHSLLDELALSYLSNRNYENFQQHWQSMLNNGIIPAALRNRSRSSMPIRTIDSRGRVGAAQRIGDFADARLAARQLSEYLFPKGGGNAAEFRQLLLKILGDGNLELDEGRRETELKKTLSSLPVKTRKIRKGEILIKSGTEITVEHLKLAEAAERAIPPELHPVVLYRLAISLILLAFTIFFLFRLYPEIVRENRKIMLAGAVTVVGMLANYAAIRFFHHFLTIQLENSVTQLSLQLFIPVTLTAILLSVMISYRVAMCCSLLVLAVTVLMLSPDNPMELLLRYMTLAALGGLVVRKVSNYRSYFVRILFSTAFLVLVLNCDLIFSEDYDVREFVEIGTIIGTCAFGSAVVALVTIFVFELVFNVSTDMSLMVLCDFNHPLLERLKREAPGTMFHSMTVGTLAEDAARAIRANPLRAKAGALYHDIGKLVNTSFFIENNRNSDELHRNLTPEQSAGIILGHVVEGMRLAKTHRLCRLIREAIRTHHGDSLVYFFYAKAQAEHPDIEVDKNSFRYGGLPPRSRELTIISLADACEAAVRSQDHPTPESIRTQVENIFLQRLKDGQLRYSLLSLKELDAVKESFISTLNSINHGRIAYTTEKVNEAAANQMVKPPSSGSGA